MKRRADQPPELIGIVESIGVGEDGSILWEGDVTLSAGDFDGYVLLLFPTHDGHRGTLRLNTKQAYHLGSALMRARARALRTLAASSN